ncbi:MAG: hypothetical protein GY874_10820 [Desulfobacteraceae bacterium]|nr:hypothetical protein [Desulfobacteraceae bacterium]
MAEESKRKLNLDQYEMLKRCSDKKNMIEWNRWRMENPEVAIWLEGANLEGANLEGANLQDVNFDWANLKKIELQSANLQGSHLHGANFQGAKLQEAILSNTSLDHTKFPKADLRGADLQEASLFQACLLKADLRGANLQRARFNSANLQGAKIGLCVKNSLQNATEKSKLQGAKFNLAHVDGLTTISECKFDKETDFTGVGLDAATIDPGLKAAFKNNIRRKNWKIWLRKGSFVKKIFKRLFVWPFWLMTNYGSSTLRITYCFFGSAIFFGLLYFWFELAEKGLVYNLDIDKMPYWHTLLRAMYFSVVTMTTLGFGDIYALNTSYWGHISLMIQVILGYVLLGALVTRLGILFTNEAPAAKPTPIKKKKPAKDTVNKKRIGVGKKEWGSNMLLTYLSNIFP